MLYNLTENLTPFALVTISIPLFAFCVGVLSVFFFHRLYLGMLLSFLLPLLYITTDWHTFGSDIDAWLL